MRKFYEKPDMAIESFDVADIITVSGGAGIENEFEQQDEPVTDVDIFEQAPPDAEVFNGAVEGLYDNLIND